MNPGTLIVLLIVAAIVGLILWKMLKDKRAGKSSCGGNCASCGHGCASSSDSDPKAGRQVRTILTIDGMACGMCESHINETIRQNFDVRKVKSSYKTGITEIISDKGPGSQALHEAIDPTGYKILNIRQELV